MKKFLIASMLVSMCLSTSVMFADDAIIQNPVNGTTQSPVITAPQKPIKASQKAKYDKLCEKANTLIDKSQYEQADAIVKQALSISSDLDMAYALKARIAFKQGKDSSIVEPSVQKALEINPNNYIANNILGNIYFNKHDYNNAVNYYKKSIESKSDYYPPYINLAETYKYKLSDANKSIEYYTKAIQYASKETFKDLQNPYIQRADAYFRLKKYDLVLKDANSALALNKNNYNAYCTIAITYARQGNFNDAIKNVNKAVQMAEGKNDIGVYLSRISIYKDMNYDYSMVLNDFKKAENAAGNDISKLQRILWYLWGYSKYDEASRISKKILDIEPNNQTALMFSIASLVNNSEYEQAEEALNKLQFDNLNNNEKAVYMYNSALIKCGLAGLTNKDILNQAITDFKKAYDYDNSKIDAWYYLGNIYLLLGDHHNSYNYYNKYLEQKKVENDNKYNFDGVYKFLLLRELSIYSNYSADNQYWGVPDWIRTNKKLDDFDWSNIESGLKSDLAGRINYSNGVSRIDDKNYILDTINMLKTGKGNIGKIYNLHINNDRFGNTSKVFVYPYVNAIDIPATSISSNDYNLLLANQYYLLIRNSVGSSPHVYSINQSDVDNFFSAINNIPKNTAANLINDLLIYVYGDGDIFNNMSLSMSFYNRVISFLRNNSLDKSAKSKQHIKELYLLMGDYYSKNGNIDTAISYYNNAIPYGMSPHKVNAYIGDYYFDSKNYFKANEYYTKALASKSDADVFLSRGQARTHLNDYGGAVDDFTKAISNNKNLELAYWERGKVLFKQKKYAIALNDFIKYSSFDKDEPAALYNAGICLYNTGKQLSALQYFERAKNVSQRVGNQDLYNSSVRMINDIQGYNRGWY